MKRVPVYLSTEEMAIIKESLAMRSSNNLNEARIVNRLDAILEEEIDRNTEPTGNNEE